MVLRIQLFGRFQLFYQGREHQGLRQPRLQALLAYLLLNRDSPQSRQQLAYLFWPDSSDSQARTNLRKALYMLRDGLPKADLYLDVDAYQARWREDAPFTLDVAAFEERLARAAEATSPGEEQRHLEGALADYAGPLLPDCYEDWIIPERERLHRLSRQARLRLVQLLEAAREYGEAVRQAAVLVEDEPLEEAGYRLLMRLHLLQGNRGRALQVYEQCVAALKQELGVRPAAATRQVYQQAVEAEAVPASPPTPPALQAGGTDRQPLIGRKREWARLLGAWEEVVGGRSLLVSIQGEAGIGKTHLAEAFLAWGEQQGITTARAHCYEGGELAFEPVVAWLRTPAIQEAVAGLDPVWLREVARLLPELSAARPELGEAGPITEVWQRQRLFEALARALLAGAEPVLLLLDDLQWSDLETLEWLRYLLRFEGEAPVLVLCTLRAEELDASHPVYAFRRQLQVRDQLVHFDLTRLGEEETAALAKTLFGYQVAPEILDRLYRETEGSPLLIVETVRAALARPGATYPVIETMTPRVQAVIESRLARLPEGARELAELAAVIGRAFTLDVLLAAGRDDADQLVAALDELCRHQLIEERSQAGDVEYRFTHDKLRQLTYERLTLARQRLLHHRVAQALETAYAPQPEDASAQIARHFEKARLFARALRYYELAAEQARRLYAYHDAERLYERAIAMAVRLNQPGEQLTRLYQQRGRMLEHAGKFEQAIGVYRDLESLARSRWDRQMECVAITHLVDCFVKPDAGHDQAVAPALIQRGLQLAQEVGAVEQEAHLLWSKMVQATHYGRTAEAQAAAEACIRLCRKHGLRGRLALTLHDLSLNLRLNGEIEKGNRYAAEAREFFREAENLPLLVDNLNQQALLDYLQLNFQAALNTAEEAGAISEGIYNGWNVAYAAWIRGMVYEARGQWDRALALWQESLQVGQAVGFLMAKTAIPVQLGLLWLKLGEVERARQLHETALAAGKETAPFMLQAAASALALDAFAAGDAAEGLRRVRQAQEQEPLGDIATALLLPLPSMALVEAAERRGEAEAWAEAQAAMESALAEARSRRLRVHEITLGYSQGRVLKALGEREAAAGRWQDTLVAARRHGLKPLTLDLAGALFQLYRKGGQEEAAEPYRQLAREAATALAETLGDEARRHFLTTEAEQLFESE